jgi:PAS domain S-box-containing protein
MRSRGDEQVYTLKGADYAYKVILETINEGAATLGEDSTVFYCNPAFAALLEMPMDQIMGNSLANYVYPADRPLYASLIEQGITERSKGEVMFRTATGNTISVLLSCSSLKLDGVQGLCLVATDLTEQKQQAELVASERLARSILEHASAAMVVCDVDGQIIRANRQAHQLSACNPILHPFEEAFPLRKYDASPDAEPAFYTFANDLSNQVLQSQEAVLVQPSGSAIYLLLSSAPLLDSESQPLGHVITLVDVTAHKQLEENLRQVRNELEQRVIDRTAELLETNVQLLREVEERKQAEIALTDVRQRLNQTQESERLLLARELHDGPLQEVIGMTFDLLLLSQMLQEEEQLAKVNSINNSVLKTARQLRLMAQTLRPPVLAHLGLAAAVRAYLKEVQETKETPVLSFVTSEETWNVPEETALALLRIVQQAVQNALQHAQANHIEVRLHHDAEWLRLEIEDDGRGFSRPYHRVDFAREGHLGVVGMAERADAIRGKLEVASQPGKGTCIRVIVLKPPDKVEEA